MNSMQKTFLVVFILVTIGFAFGMANLLTFAIQSVELLGEVLRTARDEGLSNEFALIFVSILLYLTIKSISALVNIFFTVQDVVLDYVFKKKEKKK